MPNYKNLECLLAGSSSARRYFLSLPVPLQLRLHANSAFSAPGRPDFRASGAF